MHHTGYPSLLQPARSVVLNHRGCCSAYHFVVVMFAVATIFNVVSSGAFFLTQETRHLSTEHERHTVRLQKQLDGTHAQTEAPGCGLNQLFHLNRIKCHFSEHKSAPISQLIFQPTDAAL